MRRSSPSQNFVGEKKTVREARDFVREQLLDTHVDIDSAVLLTSELASHAVVHTHSGYRVTIERHGGSVRVEFRNDAPAMLPVLRGLSEGGRGLQLVEAMASRWGTESEAGHKLVWFELPDPA